MPEPAGRYVWGFAPCKKPIDSISLRDIESIVEEASFLAMPEIQSGAAPKAPHLMDHKLRVYALLRLE